MRDTPLDAIGLRNCPPGTVLRNLGSGNAYIVIHNDRAIDGSVIAVRTVTIDNLSEWVVVTPDGEPTP